MEKGNALRQIRISKNLTLDDIFVRSRRKISQSRISKLERDILLPNERDKQVLSKVLEVSIKELFPEA